MQAQNMRRWMVQAVLLLDLEPYQLSSRDMEQAAAMK